MKYKGLRITIGVITGFIALTAIGGGIALLSGAEGERFPLEWLQGTPFKDYTIPALLLTFIVGGSSLIACITIFKNLETGVLLASSSGMIMVGFIVVEVLILKQTPPGPTPIEKMYFVLGFITFLLAGFLWRTEKGLLHQNQ
jgi:peptidoglycan/LPS O-acetylase OafA/YrhL